MKEDIIFKKYLYYIENSKEKKLYLKGVNKEKYKSLLRDYFSRKKKDITFCEKDGYKELDLSYITEYETHIMPANIETFDFSDMENEMKEGTGTKKGIFWSNCKFVNNKFQREHNFNLKDKIYIYYTNIVHGDNRILIQAEVINDGVYEVSGEDGLIEKSPYVPNRSVMYETEKIVKELTIEDDAPAILIKLTGYIDYEEEKNYTYKKLIDDYSFKVTQAKRYLNEEDEDQKRLIDALKESTRKATKYSDLIKRFNRDCLFSMKDSFDKGSSHPTFLKQNGLKYYEIHHLIERYAAKILGRKENDLLLKELKKYMKPNRKIDELFNEKELDEKFNLYTLCANCHNRIHYGKLEDRKKMVELLYKDKEHHKELNEFLRKKGVLEGQELNFILCLYGIYEEK